MVVEVIVKFNGDIEEVARQVEGSAELLKQDFAILTLPQENLSLLEGFTEIEDIELPRRISLSSDFHLTSSCIRPVQSVYGLTGKDVIVGVIDSGIDFTHPDFRLEDGSTRLLCLWDQTITGSPPQGFREGAEFSQEQINAALSENNPFTAVPSRDRNGHGTAVAGIAAGNGRASRGETMGAAPEASLIAVKVGSRADSFALTTELMRALRYVIDRAQAFGMPAAINISFGMNNGSHRGNSLFEQYLTDMADEWKLSIVVPTGNEGSAGHHFSGTVTPGSVLEIPFFTAPGLERFYLSLWKNYTDQFGVELIFPDGFSSGIVRMDDRSRTLLHRGVTLTILYGQPSRYSIDQEVLIDVRSEDSVIGAGLWQLRLHPVSIANGEVNIWLPTLEEVGSETFFTDPFLYNTMTLPAGADKLIRVAGYNDSLGSIADFSGTGSLTDPSLMPDLAAPAVNIPAPRAGGGYDTFTGTSFAAPFVTGSAALLLQWGIALGNSPYFYGERIRAALRLGAGRTPGLSYPNPTFGYGRLCLAKTLSFLL